MSPAASQPTAEPGLTAGLTEVREGSCLQGIRSLHAWLHFQPVSCLLSRLNHEGRFGISSLSSSGLLEKERSIYILQSSIFPICPKLQIYLPDLDRGWGLLCLLFRLLSLWKAGDVAMPGGGLGRAGLPGKGPATPGSRSTAALLTKCLLEATSLLIPAPKGTKLSQQLPSIRSEHLPQFCLPPSLCQLTGFFSSEPTLSGNKHQEGGRVSPITTGLRRDQAQLLLPHRSCLRTMGAGVKAAMFCTHSWAVSLALAGDLDRPLSPGGFQKTTSLCCDRFFWC